MFYIPYWYRRAKDRWCLRWDGESMMSGILVCMIQDIQFSTTNQCILEVVIKMMRDRLLPMLLLLLIIFILIFLIL